MVVESASGLGDLGRVLSIAAGEGASKVILSPGNWCGSAYIELNQSMTVVGSGPDQTRVYWTREGSTIGIQGAVDSTGATNIRTQCLGLLVRPGRGAQVMPDFSVKGISFMGYTGSMPVLPPLPVATGISVLCGNVLVEDCVFRNDVSVTGGRPEHSNYQYLSGRNVAHFIDLYLGEDRHIEPLGSLARGVSSAELNRVRFYGEPSANATLYTAGTPAATYLWARKVGDLRIKARTGDGYSPFLGLSGNIRLTGLPAASTGFEVFWRNASSGMIESKVLTWVASNPSANQILIGDTPAACIQNAFQAVLAFLPQIEPFTVVGSPHALGLRQKLAEPPFDKSVPITTELYCGQFLRRVGSDANVQLFQTNGGDLTTYRFRYGFVTEDSFPSEYDLSVGPDEGLRSLILNRATSAHDDFTTNSKSEAGHFLARVKTHTLFLGEYLVDMEGTGFSMLSEDTQVGQLVITGSSGGLVNARLGTNREAVLVVPSATTIADQNGILVVDTPSGSPGDVFEFDNNGVVAPTSVAVKIEDTTFGTLANLSKTSRDAYRNGSIDYVFGYPTVQGPNIHVPLVYCPRGESGQGQFNLFTGLVSGADWFVNSKPYRPYGCDVRGSIHWIASIDGANVFGKPALTAKNCYGPVIFNARVAHVMPPQAQRGRTQRINLNALGASTTPAFVDGMQLAFTPLGGSTQTFTMKVSPAGANDIAIGANPQESLINIVKKINSPPSGWGGNGLYATHLSENPETGKKSILVIETGVVGLPSSAAIVTKSGDTNTAITIDAVTAGSATGVEEASGSLIFVEDCSTVMISGRADAFFGATYTAGGIGSPPAPGLYYGTWVDSTVGDGSAGLSALDKAQRGYTSIPVHVRVTSTAVPSKVVISGLHVYGGFGVGRSGAAKLHRLLGSATSGNVTIVAGTNSADGVAI